MENLYKILEDKKKNSNKYKDDFVNGDYYIYFIEEFIPKIIYSVVDSLELNDIKNISSTTDIIVKMKLYILPNRDNSEPIININDNDCIIYLPIKQYDELKDKIVTFLQNNHLISGNINKDSHHMHVEAELNAHLSTLIASYGLELSKGENAEKSFESVSNIVKRLSSHISSLESIYADKIHAKLFEEEFLDNLVFNIIKEKISQINHRHYSNIEIS